MIVFFENTDTIMDEEAVDTSLGRLETDSMTVYHTWIVDTTESGHYEVVKTYPNGGKDLDWVVDIPEEGHWETRDSEGIIVQYFDGSIPEDTPHDAPREDTWEFLRYFPYTDEELSEQEAERAEQEAIVEYDAQLLAAIPMMVQLKSVYLTDTQALTVPLLFKQWTVGETYYHKEIVRYDDGELYRIGQPEITASDVYKPGDTGTESIYSHITIDEEGYEEWKPWDGVSGIYQQDQVVRDPDDGNLYISKIPNNVWGPPHSTPTYWDPYTE